MPIPDYSKPDQVIKGLREWNYDATGPLEDVSEKTITMKARDGFELRLVICQPKSPPSSPSPLIVLYHGGGWTIGRPEDTLVSGREFARKLGAVSIAPQYRLAPEHPFPQGVNDAWDSLQWIAANATSLGASPSNGFIVGGPSAGANFAAVLAHLARDEKLSPPITGVYMAGLVALPEGVVPEKYQDRYFSRFQGACMDAPVLDRPLRKLFDDAFQPDNTSPMFAVFNWPTGHHGLPPAYFQICGSDVLRDEALIYEQVLREEYGIKTRLDVYPGVPHIFWSYFPMLGQSKKAVSDRLNGVAWLLGKEIDDLK